jgi:hypothetical protein
MITHRFQPTPLIVTRIPGTGVVHPLGEVRRRVTRWRSPLRKAAGTQSPAA